MFMISTLNRLPVNFPLMTRSYGWTTTPKWIGRLDYRVYEYYGRLGDANWLTDAWLGYKINDNSKIIAGLNPVPFGLGRFWGNTYYLGIANSAG